MGWFTAVVTGAKALFTGNSSSNGMDIIKGVGSFIDEQNFTEQEKAVDAINRAQMYGAWFAQTVNENSERSRTRRELSLYVIKWELRMLFASAVVYPFDPVWAAFMFKIATSGVITSLVLGIGAFFWGTHLLRAKQESKQ